MLRNRDLHDALRQFALDAAAVLSADHEAGAEIEFEIDSEASRTSRGGPTLYRYRPLTERFVAERWPRLRALESCEPAAIALGAGAERWLRMSGLRGDEAEPALHAMLERLYEDSTGFAFPEERFERLYAEVEQMLYVEVRETRIIAPIDGLELELERVELLDGFALVRGESGDYPPEAVWPVEPDGDPPPRTLCVLEREIAPDDPLPITEARERFGRLVTGLRLFKPGGIALGAVGWTARADDRWQPLELGDAASRAGSRGSWSTARRSSCARSWSRSSGRRSRGRWRGRCRGSRWAARAGSSPRRCPTTCSRCARCSARTAGPRARRWRCGWRRCARRRAIGGSCSGAPSWRWSWSGS